MIYAQSGMTEVTPLSLSKKSSIAGLFRVFEELMAEVNADREAHGKKSFDNDDEQPPKGGKKPQNNTSKKKLARRKRRTQKWKELYTPLVLLLFGRIYVQTPVCA